MISYDPSLSAAKRALARSRRKREARLGKSVDWLAMAATTGTCPGCLAARCPHCAHEYARLRAALERHR